MHASRLLSGLYVVGALMVAAANATPDQAGPAVVLRRQTSAETTAERTAETTSASVVTTAKSASSTGSDHNPTKPAGDPIVGETNGQQEEEEVKPIKVTTTGKDGKVSTAESTPSKPTSTKTKAIDSRSPAAVVSMVEPKATEPLIYKFGETIDFKWNITKLLKQPLGINVEAYNGLNKVYYTIARNLSAQATAASWDTSKNITGDTPLVEDRYTLVIYNSQYQKTDVSKPGELGVYNGQLTFGLYSPKAAQSNEEFKCVGCSAASGVHVVMGSTLIAVASAMFFVLGRV